MKFGIAGKAITVHRKGGGKKKKVCGKKEEKTKEFAVSGLTGWEEDLLAPKKPLLCGPHRRRVLYRWGKKKGGGVAARVGSYFGET